MKNIIQKTLRKCKTFQGYFLLLLLLSFFFFNQTQNMRLLIMLLLFWKNSQGKRKSWNLKIVGRAEKFKIGANMREIICRNVVCELNEKYEAAEGGRKWQGVARQIINTPHALEGGDHTTPQRKHKTIQEHLQSWKRPKQTGRARWHPANHTFTHRTRAKK